jgi:hypothetical protein
MGDEAEEVCKVIGVGKCEKEIPGSFMLNV